MKAIESGSATTLASTPTFYAGPFRDDYIYHNDGESDTVQNALAKWWAQYQKDWRHAFPGCSYTVSYYSNGETTGRFAHFRLHGTCGGGGNIFGTASHNKPGKNSGDGRPCSGGNGSAGGDPQPASGGSPGGDACPQGSTQTGDPINAATGNKYQQETDIRLNRWLTFRRFYNSTNSVASSAMGSHWRHSFARSLSIMGQVAVLFRPDGSQETFKQAGTDWTSDTDVADTLAEQTDDSGQPVGYTVYMAGPRQLEHYSTTGQLQSIDDLSGQSATLTYSDASTPVAVAPRAGLLIRVSDSHGRTLDFTYNSKSRISQLIGPDGSILSYTYSSGDDLTSVTWPDGTTRHYLYNEMSHTSSAVLMHVLTGVMDESGERYETTDYNAHRQAIAAQFAGGADLTRISYASNASTVTYPLGVSVTIGFDLSQGRAKVASVSGNCSPQCNQPWETRTFDANGYPASYTDFNGNVTQVTYDRAGLMTQQTEAQGQAAQRTTSTIWDEALRVPLQTTLADAADTVLGTTQLQYNARGQAIARCHIDPAQAAGYACTAMGTPPAGVRRWTYRYCDAVGAQCPLVGLLLSVDGPRIDVADVTQYTYYETTDESGCSVSGGACHHLGDLWKVTDALGHLTEMASYDKDGRPAEIIDPNGISTRFTYTPRGWLHTRTVAGATITLDYDAVGNLIRLTQPDGVFSSYSYDAAHRLIGISDALGNHLDFTLDAAGNRIAEHAYAAGSGTPSRSLGRVYNNLGQLVQQLDAYGHPTTYTYDADSNRTGTTNALGVPTHASYDALHRLVQVVRNYLGVDAATANTTTSFDLDARDNVSQVTDPDGLITRYDRDGLNNLGQLQSPDTGTATYTYDDAGNRISQTDARGITRTLAYDALNRLTTISYPTASEDVHYTFGDSDGVTGCSGSYPIGRLTQMLDASGSTTWCYDARGNVTRKTQIVNTATYVTTYAYNLADRLMEIDYPQGARVAYTRDADGRIAAVAATPAGGVASPVVTAIEYLPMGPASAYTFGNGEILRKTFDQDYRPTGVISTPLTLQYTLDALGNPVALADEPAQSAPVETYAYDPLNRLQQVDHAAAPWQSYTWNPTGDRLSKTTAGLGTDIYQYQSGTHRLTALIGAEPSDRAQDANGNTTALQADGWTYGFGYDDSNRMTAVEQSGTRVMTYILNGQGQRVRKIPQSEPEHGCKKPHKPGKKPKKHCIPTQGNVTDFVYDRAGHLLAEYGEATSRAYIWADNTLVAVLDNPLQGAGDTINYVYTDQLGTPRAVTTQAGATLWTWPQTLNPFGERAPSDDGYTFNLRYPGQYFDAETGLSYNYFRDYEPATGRYIESDPIGLNGGFATYGFVHGSPLKHVDSLGLDDTQCMYNPSACGMDSALPGGPSPRLPDYATFQMDGYVFSISATYTEYGDAFLGIGLNRAYPNPLSGGVSISAGWMINPCGDGHPKRKVLNKFVGGYSGGAGGYFGLGGSFSAGPSGRGFNIGVGVGDVSVGPGTLNRYQGNVFGEPKP